MMNNETNNLTMRAYALVGQAATAFAALEFQLQFLVSYLIMGKPMSIESMLLTRNHTFADKIQTLEDFVPIRLKMLPLRSRADKLISELKHLRSTRNLFTHGFWLINDLMIQTEGVVKCSDTRWKSNKDKTEWTTMAKTTELTLAALTEIIRRTGAAATEVGVLSDEIKSFLNKKKAEPGVSAFNPARHADES